MSTYDRFRNMSSRLLGGASNRSLGRPMKLISLPEEPEIDERGNITNMREVEALGVRMNFRQHLIDGTSIKNSDVLIYLYAEDVNGCPIEKPKPRDSIECFGEEYVIVNCDPWDFDGKALAYKIHARVSD